MSDIKRTVTRTVRGAATSDGAGVRLTRIIGNRSMMDLDPFLLFDEFKSDNPDDYIGGFPDHPHRGFETVTYLIAGMVDHADSAGASGSLLPGGAQWMTAGRGLVHSELPKQKNGLLWGFQLWVNLPARSKMVPPRYQDIAPEAIPHVQLTDGAVARVLAGHLFGVTGPVEGIVTVPLFVDISLPPGVSVQVPVEEEKSAFVYMVEGKGKAGGVQLPSGTLGQLSDGDIVEVSADNSGCRFFVVAARPLNEPVARWGPFVMNTDEEIQQAISDYQAGLIKN